jgi:hypothetical protein
LNHEVTYKKSVVEQNAIADLVASYAMMDGGVILTDNEYLL